MTINPHTWMRMAEEKATSYQAAAYQANLVHNALTAHPLLARGAATTTQKPSQKLAVGGELILRLRLKARS